MRLSLKQTTGRRKGQRAKSLHLEHGRITLGRAPDCNLQIEDPSLSVSKHHCTIERDRSGFLLKVEGVNGVTVDGVRLREGQAGRLRKGSSIAFCGFEFAVDMTGEPEPDMDDPAPGLKLSDEAMPTISSILADVAPAGHTAHGVLPGRSDAGAPDALAMADAGTMLSSQQPSSRRVQIGWGGPPEMEMPQVHLPDDWNSTSDYSSRIEHYAATNTVVQLSPRRGAAPDEERAEAGGSVADRRNGAGEEVPAEDAVASFRNHRLKAVASGGPKEIEGPTGNASGEILALLDHRLRQVEDMLSDFLAKYGLEAGHPNGSASTAIGMEAVAERMDALATSQALLQSAVDRLIAELSQKMEPRAIEARAEAQDAQSPWRLQLPGSVERACWRAFKANFEKDGRALSVAALFEAAFRTEIAARQIDQSGGSHQKRQGG